MQLGVCVEMVLSKLAFEDRLRKAAEIGLENVEMWMVDGSFKGGPDELARLCERHGVRMTNTVIGSANGAVGGGLTNPASRRKWLDRARMTIDFTKAAGIGATIVCTGNAVEGMSDEQMMRSVLEGLKPTVELAEAAGVTLLLEPLNNTHDHTGHWLTSSDRAAEICRRIGSARMRMLFDCYHMQIMEGDLARHIERNLDVIGHFHSGGVPGRHELYEGEINYRFLVKQIESLGYRGVFGLEYVPSCDCDTSLRKTLEYLRGN